MPLCDISEESLLERFTYVSHQSYLFQGTVRENLLMGCPNAGEDALWMALEDGMPLIVTIMGLSIPAICIVASVYVLIERIKEIRSGVEDDLDKY